MLEASEATEQEVVDEQVVTETVNETETQPVQNGASGKVFTQADVDRILKDRLGREKDKSAKAAEKAKADAARKALEEQNEFKKLYEAEKAEREKALAEMQALKLADLRRQIATELKVPSGLASRIAGTTREEIEADAKQLLAALPTPTAPTLNGRAGGGTGNASKLADKEKDADLKRRYGI